MAGIDINEAKPREELPDKRDQFVRNILAFCASYKQRRLHKPNFIGVLVREIAKITQRAG